MSYMEWETEVYPKMWHLAYDAGEKARKEGKPRVCDLGEEFRHNGVVLKLWRCVWEQGWDGWKIPVEFKQVEAVLDQLPLRPMTECDF